MTFSGQEGVGGTSATQGQGVERPSATHTGLVPGETKRLGRRVVSPGLKVSVVKKTLFGAREIAFVDLLDLGRGGICLASSWLKARLDQKLDLELYHAHQTLRARGIVTRVTPPDPHALYGVAFIFAPPELDRLIEVFLQARAPAFTDHAATAAPREKRQAGKRLAASDAQIYVKRTGSADPFVRCEVDNVSHGGLGFYCATRLATKAPFKVAVQISDSPKAGVITGTVHYMAKQSSQYYYGLEFELVSTELVRLLDRLDQSDQQAIPA
jgi:hypothetical protein